MTIFNKMDTYFRKNQRILKMKIILGAFVLLLTMGTFLAFLTAQENDRKVRLLFYICQYLAMILVIASSNIVKRKWKIKIPIFLDASFVIFAFCGFILGDVFDFYGRIPIWDSILHTFSGVILATVGFVIIDNMVKVQKVPVSLSPVFVSIVVVLFSLSLGALWEIGEYIYDDVFGTNTQQFMESTSGTLVDEEDVPLVGHAALEDTMSDLILDFVGAVAVTAGGYWYIKRNPDRNESGPI